MESYKVIGLMSGTSLDGIDIAYCELMKQDECWEYQLLNTTTITYDLAWKEKLISLEKATGEELAKEHSEYGELLGELTNEFIKMNGLQPDFIASHGHTLFHQPENGFTFQLGNGATISAIAQLPVVCDFRTTDIALGGQGAPLVPIGDQLLFPQYDLCLNLGGFANISYQENGTRSAFDICPVNMALNYFATQLGRAYDEGGKISRSGKVNDTLLFELNAVPFYAKDPPKSLGKEWFLTEFLSVLLRSTSSIEDKLRTICEHIVVQISNAIKRGSIDRNSKVLLTGGGTNNQFLIELLKKSNEAAMVIPDPTMIEFKEALIFAFLGVLRWRGEINCLSSVTGAKKDSIGGVIYMP